MNPNDREAQKKAWEKLSQELGSQVQACIMGKALAGAVGVPSGEWGLYILTEGGLHYRHDPSEGFLAGVIRLGTNRKDAPRHLHFPYSDVKSAIFHHGPFWKRLLAGENDFIRLIWKTVTEELSFEPLEGGAVWVQHLQSFLNRSQDSNPTTIV